MKPVIAITVGDHNGVGPEVALKSVTSSVVRRLCTPVLVGPAAVFEYYAHRFKLKVSFEQVSLPQQARVPLHAGPKSIGIFEPASCIPSQIRPGKMDADAGRLAALAIEQSVALALAGRVEALLTAPVAKRALHLAGVRFPGQTEMVQSLSGSPRVAMMLVSRIMRVGLVTIHLPLREVAAALTAPLLRERISTIHAALRDDWNIRRPRIAILGLNPHAGESGDLGREEEELIRPVMRELSGARMRLAGPFPADAFFGRYVPGSYDAVVAMYHDQGLVALKMSSMGRAVNVSVGLSIIRTSPDHGTAFNIAGKGIADPGSMIEAARVAAQLAVNRRTRRRRRL